MKTFDGDDKKYLAWLDKNQRGFVVNTRANAQRKPTPSSLMLHCASCTSIGRDNSNVLSGGFTQRQYIKICAPTKDKLRTWVKKITDGALIKECGRCKP